MRRFILVAILCIGAPGVGWAQSGETVASPAPFQSGLSFTHLDLARLFQAVADVHTSPEINVTISAKPVSEMPAYDSTCHYVGISGAGEARVANIWCTLTEHEDQTKVEDALMSAMLLAVMDYGFAGQKWKAIYDSTAAADAALPVSDGNPYLNRLALTRTIQQTMPGATRPK
jgi:hypothetical protein